MKRILHIARNELNILFYSPIAWVLLVIFVLMTNWAYLEWLDIYLKWLQLGGFYLTGIHHLTDCLVAGTFLQGPAIFGVTVGNLYLFLPLITMGLVSREVNNGTIKLLYSSPIKVSEFVIGKFLAMLFFILILMMLLIPNIIAWVSIINNPDYFHIFTSFLGSFVVLAAYASIGLFISSLTSYQAVAALITFMVFSVFSKIGQYWQDVEFVRYITQYLSIDLKAINLIRGLYNLRDFSYFGIITIVFLLCTVIKIRSATQSVSRARKFARYALVLAVGFMAGYITNNPFVNIYHDTSRHKQNTLSPSTQTILKGLDKGPMEIKIFANILHPNFGHFVPEAQLWLNTLTWEKYIRFKPDLKIEYVYYYDTDPKSNWYTRFPGKSLKEIAKEQARVYRMNVDDVLTPREVSKYFDTKKEDYNNLYRITYNGRTETLRTFMEMDPLPTEAEIAATLKRLWVDPPTVLFLAGELERSPFMDREGDYRLITAAVDNRRSLINQGLGFDTISAASVPDLPTNNAGLVIADPRVPFDDATLKKINRYVANGGNLMINAEPERKEVLQPLLNELGVTIRPGLLLEPTGMFESDRVSNELTPTAQNLTPVLNFLVKQTIKIGGDTIFNVVMNGAATLSFEPKNGFAISTLLTTDSTKSWNRIAPVNKDSLSKIIAKRADDETGKFVTAVLLERNINGKKQRIVVCSDADLLTRFKGGGWGSAFGFYCLGSFTNNEFPIDVRKEESIDDTFSISREEQGPFRIIFYYVIPLILIISGSIFLVKRKRK